MAHKVCVDKCEKSLRELETISGFEIKLNLNKHPQKVRLELKKIIESNKGEIRIQHLERLNLIEHLQRLQHLQALQALQALQITNLSYNEVEIKDNSIIYCDPPYEGTGEYRKGGFDHASLNDWALNNPNPVFISEYEMPKEFLLVSSFKHKSTLSATNNNKHVIENLYWNGK